MRTNPSNASFNALLETTMNNKDLGLLYYFLRLGIRSPSGYEPVLFDDSYLHYLQNNLNALFPTIGTVLTNLENFKKSETAVIRYPALSFFYSSHMRLTTFDEEKPFIPDLKKEITTLYEQTYLRGKWTVTQS